MSEYKNVEKPFLEKLRAIGWEVIDHGGGAEHPTDPTISRRTSFNELGVFDHFREWVGRLNPWASEAQLRKGFDILTTQTGKLIEANKYVFNKLHDGLALVGERNAVSGDADPVLKLVDFKHPENNGFLAINQFQLDTPGMAKSYIVPDIVCLVNGLPWVVIECKDENVAEPLSDAWEQIRRYSNQRKDPDDSYEQDEGKEELFHANLFNVITRGQEARFGTISGEFDYYYNWQDIFPEKYKTVDTLDGGVRQEVLIGGMFNHEILLDIIKASEIKVQIRDMRTRWGSCTPGGTLTYNWRCALVPLRVLDYLVVHELTHLEYHRHSREFWSKIASLLPDYETSVEWLRKNGIRTEF